MEISVQFALYNPGLNCFIQGKQTQIPSCWAVLKDEFLHPSLYYKKILARWMLIDLIESRFSKFDPAKTGLEKGKLTYSGLSVSVSYSQNMVLVGIADHGLIGMDIEAILPLDYSLFEQIVTDDERIWLRQANHKPEAFYTLWTRKEAVVKADGRGLAVELSSFSSLPDQIKLPNASQSWHLLSLRFLDDYLFSMASSIMPKKIGFEPFIRS